mmetsp:Transcript_74396/g.147848  ORF Transcript_74396/g.147848 Transcript_74396/m.147848 type:complete len:205 (-) Transcript_74396:384-998(-)
MIEGSVQRSVELLNGAVRHAAESFNFYWPQELDDDFLVIWDGHNSKVHWKHMGPADLRAFLIDRIADGYVFPINPKWILVDEGWYDVYTALKGTEVGRQAVDAWLPPRSGLQEHIEAVHAQCPGGFVQLPAPDAASGGSETIVDIEMAELQLKRHTTLRRAKIKLKAALRLAMAAQAAQRQSPKMMSTAAEPTTEPAALAPAAA